MKKIIIIIGISIFLFSNFAYAQTWAWVAPVRYVESITSLEGATVFKLSGYNVTTNSSCINNFILRTSDPNYNAMTATLLTAYSLGSPISVRFDWSATSCEVTAQRLAVY